VALLEDRDLAELYVEKHNNRSVVGNIYKGRVENVLPGMQAAFVNIGIDKNVFLYVKDAMPNTYIGEEEESDYADKYKNVNITDFLKVGQEIVVQVVKEPISTKGARVTTHITLPGRFIVLMPTVEYTGISRRIENEQERERLKSLAAKHKPATMGVIIRTAAEGCNEEEIKEDIDFLSKLWENIKSEQHNGPVPRIIHKDINIVYRTVRDVFTNDIDKFVINNKEQYEMVAQIVRLLSQDLVKRVEYFDKEYEIFEYYDIKSKISKVLTRKVWLKSGGYLIIDQTEALTVVDVNTGKFVGSIDLRDTVLKTNVEAAREIAKQLRLRDIGGIIIIDFIDMHEKQHEEVVLDVLKNSLKKDRTKSNVLGITQLGLVEMTRKKVRQRVDNVFMSECPNCNGEGKIISRVE
ncbi:MAG: Rne/Rng family ribonuclease, partial [Clostridia bacterium]|nr:Rne/Rng family ribonuclease [Clostridia bacterium]